MHTITIFKEAGCWLAHHSDPAILPLFGTDVLPTPFTDHTPADDVAAELVRLNPDRRIIVNRGRA